MDKKIKQLIVILLTVLTALAVTAAARVLGVSTDKLLPQDFTVSSQHTPIIR